MQRLSPAEVHERIAYIESLRQALGDAQTDTALAELRQAMERERQKAMSCNMGLRM